MTSARLTKIFLAAALGLVLLGAMGAATGKVLRWDLENVTFDDGGTASGFFLFDANASPDKHALDWNVAIEGTKFSVSPCSTIDPGFPPVRLTPTTSAVNYASRGSLVLATSDPYHYDPIGRVSLQLQLNFDSSLSDAGGTVALGPPSVEAWTYVQRIERAIVTGQIVAIPEPSEALFLVLGLAALANLSAQEFAARYTRRNA